MYWFSDAAHHVLYVGKAKNLTNRLQNYRRVKQLVPRIHRMVHTATKLQYQELESELEALLVEAELIRLHQPPFNVLLKDDKSPLYINITDEPFPRVLTCRKKEIDQGLIKGTLLGPFPSAYKVREVLKIARQIFPWCNAPRQLDSDHPRACFYYHLGLCPGVCLGSIDMETYRHTIKQLTLFLRGQKKAILRQLQQEMKAAAVAEQFEIAQILRDRISLISSVTERKYQLRPDLTLPSLRLNQAEERLTYLRQMLSQYLSIPKTYPLQRVEAYDVSNTSGQLASVAMVVAEQGLMNPSEYRLFNIRTLNTPNDFAMHQEALQRRQNHAEWGTPDLIVIDGGKGQLRAALKVWQWACPVVGLAKDPDRLIIPGLGLTSPDAKTRATTPRYHEILLDPTNPGVQLLQQLRDESHRFSNQQHARRRTRHLLPK